MNKGCLKRSILKDLKGKDHERVISAYDFGNKHLTNIKRRSGENYFEHGCRLALTLREVSDDPTSIIVLLLHDLLVFPEGKSLIKKAPINSEEEELLRYMNDLRRLHIDEDTNDLDLVIDAFTRNERLILLRMVHRLNDIRNINKFNKKFQRELSNETLHMYAALAGRLGFHTWRREMEDICFRVLHPKTAKNLLEQFHAYHDVDVECLKQTEKFLKRILKKNKIDARIDNRIKSLYSTYRKMLLKHRKFKELTDRLALRIIVDGIDTCYRTLGVIQTAMNPMPGKLKDYIGAPKENGYKSIHSVVYPLPGVTERPIEIQIRTKEMHFESEYGIAAHIDYKKLTYNLTARPTRVNLFRNLEILKGETRTPDQFRDALRTYFNEDRLIIFDHKNNLYHLKKPATALDFAFIIFGERCKRLKQIFVNGREQAYDFVLSDGDVVQVKFGREVSFEREWKGICFRDRSREVIRNIVKK
ncbi:HD domain-containing protein [Candidatus Peregrinibacteria bacterium]|nr:HD domain-containing protein [Candidatus Peregrinibacteria bacterium]